MKEGIYLVIAIAFSIIFLKACFQPPEPQPLNKVLRTEIYNNGRAVSYYENGEVESCLDCRFRYYPEQLAKGYKVIYIQNGEEK